MLADGDAEFASMDVAGTGAVKWHVFKAWWDARGHTLQLPAPSLQLLLQVRAQFDVSYINDLEIIYIHLRLPCLAYLFSIMSNIVVL